MTNPKCRKVEIGVREIKEITLWPLSLADELAFSEKIVGLVEGYEAITNQPLPEIPEDATEEQLKALLNSPNAEVQIATFVIKAIKTNLLELLSYVSDDEVTLHDLDNELVVGLTEHIYEMSFAGAVGKGKLLLVKVKGLFHQKKQSDSSSLQPATDTNISTSSDTEMGE